MTIKVFRVVESTEDGDNLLGYGFADELTCFAKIGSSAKMWFSEYGLGKSDIKPEIFSSAFDEMVQEQTDDLRYYRVEYQEYDLGNTPFVFGKEVAVNAPYRSEMPPMPEWLIEDTEEFKRKLKDSGMMSENPFLRGGEVSRSPERFRAEVSPDPDWDKVHSSS